MSCLGEQHGKQARVVEGLVVLSEELASFRVAVSRLWNFPWKVVSILFFFSFPLVNLYERSSRQAEATSGLFMRPTQALAFAAPLILVQDKLSGSSILCTKRCGPEESPPLPP